MPLLRRAVPPPGSPQPAPKRQLSSLQHPIDYGRARTHEDPSIKSPPERLANFGQADHVRIYGRDFRERVERAGVEVELVRPGLALDPWDRARYGILDPEDSFRADDIYVCRPR